MNTQTPNPTVYISNLSYDRDRNALKSMFSQFGEIKNIKIVVEPSTNQSRGMAFIEMGNVEQAKKAIATLDKKIFDGRTVKLKFATPLRQTSTSRFHAEKKDKMINKDLEFKAKQLAKKARNDERRASNPLNLLLAAKKTKKA
jgi:RNA recognition motif-containing protein